MRQQKSPPSHYSPQILGLGESRSLKPGNGNKFNQHNAWNDFNAMTTMMYYPCMKLFFKRRWCLEKITKDQNYLFNFTLRRGKRESIWIVHGKWRRWRRKGTKRYKWFIWVKWSGVVTDFVKLKRNRWQFLHDGAWARRSVAVIIGCQYARCSLYVIVWIEAQVNLRIANKLKRNRDNTVVQKFTFTEHNIS